MTEFQINIGSVVKSRSGRDEGRYFLVREITADDYLMLVDGVVRKLDKPKKKKRKHVEVKPVIAEAIAAKWSEGKKVFDAEIRSALQNLGFNNQEK